MMRPHDKPHDDRTPAGAYSEPLAADKNGDDVSLLDQLAEFSQSAGEYGSAMEYYEQILRIAERARESSGLLADVLYKMATCHVQIGDYSKALRHLDAALENLPEGSGDLAFVRIQNERAFALISLGDYERAEACVRDITDRLVEPATAAELARAQRTYGVIAMRRGEWATAQASFEAAAAGFRLIGDRSGLAQCLNNVALMEKNRGNAEAGIASLRQALECFEELGDTPNIGRALNNLGLLEFRSGDWESAREHHERAARLLEGIGHKWERARILLNLGNYYRYKRDWAEADRHYQEASAWVDELGEARERVLVCEFRGDLALASESYDEARALYHEGLKLGEELAPHGDLVLECHRRLADLESRAARVDEARHHLRAAMDVSEHLGEEFERGILFRTKAGIEAQEGDQLAAVEAFEESIALLVGCGSPYELAVTRLEFATFCIHNTIDLVRAGDLLEAARTTFDTIGAEYEAGHAYLMAAKLEMACEHPTGEARHHLDAAIDLLERVGSHDDRRALREVNRDIDRLLEESSLSERNDLAALNAAVARIHGAPDAESRVRELEYVLRARVNANRVGIFIATPDSNALALARGSSLAPGDVAPVLETVRLLRGERTFGQKPLVSTSPGRDPRLTASPIDLGELGSIVFLPLSAEDVLCGGIYVDLAQDDGYFQQSELDFVVALGTSAVLALQEMRLESVRSENARLRRELTRRNGFEGIITQNRKMLEILDVVERLSNSRTTVLLQGETGTGKELIAHALHRVSNRAKTPLVAVNCAALSRDVLVSELFGHVKGAFTDAKSDQFGLFQKADGGTIFLDEIDKTGRDFQESLLRVVDQGEVRPVGSNQVRRIDVRILCASNRPLKELVEEGSFLADLYYRLRVISIDIPPLRERKEDIPLLVDHFLNEFSTSTAKPVAGFTHEAMNAMVAHRWPGNVRDLRHEVERAFTMADEDASIDVGKLSDDLRPAPATVLRHVLPVTGTLPSVVEQLERDLVVSALRKTDGNRSHAAKLLGISRRGLLNKIARYELDV